MDLIEQGLDASFVLCNAYKYGKKTNYVCPELRSLVLDSKFISLGSIP